MGVHYAATAAPSSCPGLPPTSCWPCPTADHPGVSTLYLDHISWYAAAEALYPKNKGKRFLTPSGKVEICSGD